MKLKNLHDLLVHELTDLYSAERQLAKALPSMVRAASDEELRECFEAHLAETMNHVARLEMIAQSCDIKFGRHKCKGMEGLIREGKELISEDADDHVRDAGLIGAAQRLEHYEIAGYGTARALAKCLGYDEAVKLLSETLEEEKAADKLLTTIAETAVNTKADAALVDA
ncbi:ferritin-like domain-containing protein [Brevifollis gellanilyticus]|uniref:Uncharacterized protein n=1 Tax=Brevifollis gellanilyticus TaxID=748831 RepID=A0A512M2F5_9BACT|nr:ferritin-like domain-containing protein [Brevifollis gellanilyticus]GEP40924.1 hypothetical protein BGE01nite_02150 [Brevifollis gellanilyticus]